MHHSRILSMHPLQPRSASPPPYRTQMLHLPQRRHVRTRRSGVTELVQHTVMDALGLGDSGTE